jgi:repressor LexA
MCSRRCWRRCWAAPERQRARRRASRVPRAPPRRRPTSPRTHPPERTAGLDRRPAGRYICIKTTGIAAGDSVLPMPAPASSRIARGRPASPGPAPALQELTAAQQELYDWLEDYIGSHRHSPSIRQMMEAMGLRSPAPIQSRLRHLQQKGWITWQGGQARTLQLLGGQGQAGIPLLGAVAAGGLVETFDDVQECLDLAPVLETRGLFALTVHGDSMVEAHITEGDVVLMEPVTDPARLREGTIVSALVPGSGTTLKHFHRLGSQVRLEAANPAYEPIVLPADQVSVQGKLVAVWRRL